MNTIKNLINKILSDSLILPAIFILGAIGLSISFLRETFLILTPYILVISSLYVIYRMKLHYTLIAVLSMIAVLGLVLEIVGVLTGVPFGEYTYGSVMGVQILDVPLVIALNWAMIIFCSYIFTQQLISKISTKYLILTPIITSLVAVLFDYIMEPVAIFLGFWNWKDVSVPNENYITWILFSFIASILIYITTRGGLVKEFKVPILYLISQLIFFTILNITILIS